MADNRLKLKEQEIAFIRQKYADIDLDNLLMYAEGLSSITNLDLLLSRIRYDLSQQIYRNEEAQLAEAITKKAQYYKDHNGRNLVEGFDSDALAREADNYFKEAFGTPMSSELFQVDQLINYIRLKEEIMASRKKLGRVIVCVGTRLGEIMLEEGLLARGCEWAFTEKSEYPLLCDPDGNIVCDPIGFIYRKFTHRNSLEDKEGTCSDFYYAVMDHLE